MSYTGIYISDLTSLVERNYPCDRVCHCVFKNYLTIYNIELRQSLYICTYRLSKLGKFLNNECDPSAQSHS